MRDYYTITELTREFDISTRTIRFYEDVGSASYKVASEHEAARVGGLAGIFQSLAADFHGVRLALNRLADSLLNLDGNYHSGVLAP